MIFPYRRRKIIAANINKMGNALLPNETEFPMDQAQKCIHAFSYAPTFEAKYGFYKEAVEILTPLTRQDSANPRAAFWLAALSEKMARYIVKGGGYNPAAEDFLVRAMRFLEIACVMQEDAFDSVARAHNVLAMHYLNNPHLKFFSLRAVWQSV